MKQNKTKTTEFPRLYIRYDYTESGGGICEDDEDDAWPSYDDTDLEYTYDYAKRTVPTGNAAFSRYESMEVPVDVHSADKVFLAIVVYRDGGSFKSTNGYHHIAGAFKTRKEAEERLELITQNEEQSAENYKPWIGYFAKLQGTKVIKLDIED